VVALLEEVDSVPSGSRVVLGDWRTPRATWTPAPAGGDAVNVGPR